MKGIIAGIEKSTGKITFTIDVDMLLTDEECIIENVPYVEDTKVLLQAIENIGAKVKYIDTHTVSINAGSIMKDDDLCVDDEYIRKIRSQFKKAKLSPIKTVNKKGYKWVLDKCENE